MNLEEYLVDHADSRGLLNALRAVILGVGTVTEELSKSQLAFRAGRTFAIAWAPAQYLGERGAPLVLSLALPQHVENPRWKEVVEPRAGVFMHHLELRAVNEIDDEVRDWITRAYVAAR
ncbi:hypothetical protein HDC37_003063 [Microbacterium sp. AK009]|uniref:DUF5655 domain-containing protein n=1 Tax=Microbacterium sp. AK009 TaxID=2723068 RepID=UPI0015C84253|nr:DUF5655 domain-containing protein [Microbacterium sp. AK009]NYF18207.1 hypothetical protein [Microbacterium sp. AK009]